MAADDPKRPSPKYAEIGGISCFRGIIARQGAFD